MTKLSVVNFVSLDGVVQSPNSPDEDRDGGFDRGGWVPPYSDRAVEEFMRDSTVGADALLLGRRTYEIMAEAWSGADETELAIAAMNRMPKYVVTGSLGELGWRNAHLLGPDLPERAVELKAKLDGDLVVFGSGELVKSLAHHDLVDEYRLLQFPVVLGAGKRMFDDRGAPAPFDLVDCVMSATGVAILTYARRSHD